MKLNEIAKRDVETSLRFDQYDFRRKVKDDPDRHKHLGTGATAVVTHPNADREPGTVSRFSNVSDRGTIDTVDDSYLQYILKAAQEGDGNPYLPRAEEITRYRSKTSGMRNPIAMLRVKTEMLRPFSSMEDPDMVNAVYKRMFSEPLPKEAAVSEWSGRAAIVTQLNYAVVSGDTSLIKDPLLKKAVELIRATFSDLNTKFKRMPSFDIHSGNVMWRLTSVGPQLVITDPLI